MFPSELLPVVYLPGLLTLYSFYSNIKCYKRNICSECVVYHAEKIRKVLREIGDNGVNFRRQSGKDRQ